MKKAIVLLLGGVVLLMIAGGVIFWGPNYLYYKIIKGQIKTDQYVVKNISFYLGSEEVDFFTNKPKVLEGTDEERYWKLFHIADYKIFLPLSHPVVDVCPIINFIDLKKSVELGVKFLTHRAESVAEVVFKAERPFQHDVRGQKLFEIPIVSRYLEKIAIDSLWIDLFQKNIGKGIVDSGDDIEIDETFFRRKKKEIKFFLEKVARLAKLNYSEMVYNLYLIDLRQKYLPAGSIAFFYDEEKSYGVFVTEGESSQTKKSTYLMLNQGQIYSFTIEANLEDPLAREIALKIYKSVYYSPSNPSDSQMLYGNFIDLPYEQKIDQNGMIYLYSAWSHKMEDQDLLRQVITFLERGGNHFTRLQPFYSYAEKKFGNDFLNKSDPLENLKKNIRKEDLKDLESAVSQGPEQPVFASPENRFRFYLKKINESKEKKTGEIEVPYQKP